MELSFRNRIALFTATAAAITIGVVFLLVYGVVYQTAYQHLDDDIRQEKEKFVRNLVWQGDSISIRHLQEEEMEGNNQADVNPTFLQLTATDGHFLFRSPNLKDDSMGLNTRHASESSFYNVQMGNRRVRQGQFPILNRRQKTIGYVLIGISREESAIVLHNLRNTLLATFPLLLIALYWATALSAFKGIAPVKQLIKAAGRISEANIDTRLPVPANKDEIHQLALTINELLERIERGVQREKQFTADASHEIRTPLTAIRGILEVLIRKKRTPEQYEEKIGHVIQEVDRLHAMSEQLLAVARMESNTIQVQKNAVALHAFFQSEAQKWQPRLQAKNMTMHLDMPASALVHTDAALLRVMVDNLLDNSLKYGHPGGRITCQWLAEEHCLRISDDGPGIAPENLPHLFERFFRADEARSTQIPGAGLGLSVVKKLADLLHIELSAANDQGAVFSLRFKAA